MIFLSHNHKDKPIVEPLAVSLRSIFGQDEVFYDEWSIQPGDGIIDKMNKGIEESTIFLFFVSKNSLQSKMVDFEWQNALYKSTKGNCKLVPIRIDDCYMPPILMQNLYIDLFLNGFEIAQKQIIDFIQGNNNFIPKHPTPSNLFAEICMESDGINVRIRAKHFLEPIAHFGIMLKNEKNDFKIEKLGMFQGGFNKDVELENGRKTNVMAVILQRPITPSVSIEFFIRQTGPQKLIFEGILHKKSDDFWGPVELKQV